MKKGLLTVLGLLLLATPAWAQAAALPYSHAYYLFLAGSHNGCEDCYVPMLITRLPVEESGSSPADGIIVVTYERDSIFDIEKDPAVVTSISAPARKLRWKDKEYRYQEVSRSEALHLLSRPMGTILISRTVPPNVSANKATIAMLIQDLQSEPAKH